MYYLIEDKFLSTLNMCLRFLLRLLQAQEALSAVRIDRKLYCYFFCNVLFITLHNKLVIDIFHLPNCLYLFNIITYNFGLQYYYLQLHITIYIYNIIT